MKLGAVLVLCVLCQACSCPGGRRGPTAGARDAGGRDAIVDPDAPDRPVDGSTSPVDCSDEARWIYLVDSANKFLRFEPDTNMLTEVGTLACPGGSTPFSMAVDRNATAWVLHQDHRIYHVDVTTVACNATSYAPDQMGLELFGMGFVSDATGSDDETLFIGGGPEAGIGGGSSTLAFVDEVTLAVGTIGPMTGSPELTGNGAGELWGFFPDATPMAVRQIDKGSGTTVREFDVSAVDAGGFGTAQAWAFAFWGGRYYIFYQGLLDASSSIWRLTPDTGAVDNVRMNTGYRIVGAGVSTCAPIILI